MLSFRALFRLRDLNGFRLCKSVVCLMMILCHDLRSAANQCGSIACEIFTVFQHLLTKMTSTYYGPCISTFAELTC
jgi:hypothetical protein